MPHAQLRHLAHGRSTANYRLSALHAHETGTLLVVWDIRDAKDRLPGDPLVLLALFL